MTRDLRKPSLMAAATLTCTLVCVASSYAQNTNLTTTEWVTANRDKLDADLNDKSVVNALVRRALESQSLDESFDSADDQPNVVDARFVDLNGDGHLYLIGRLDYSGRNITLSLVVVSQIGQVLHGEILDPHAEIKDLSSVLRDLRGNGKTEFVIETKLKSSSRVTPASSFPHIYEYHSGHFIIEDHSYKEFYRNIVLPSLQKRLSISLARESNLKLSSPEAASYEAKTVAALSGSIKAVSDYLEDSR